MKEPFIILFTLILTAGLNAQNFEWAKSFGGRSNDFVSSITVDGSGNVYTTGYFSGTADFNPGAGTYNLISAGETDIFVQKLDSSGKFIWAKSFGGNTYDFGRSITVDGSGNVYTTGQFQGTVDFDPGTDTANITSAGKYDIYVLKLDAAGNFIWAKSFGGSSDDYGRSITVDGSGNVYSTGGFEGTVNFDPDTNTTNITVAKGYSDIYVLKLDVSGNFIWAKSFGDTFGDGVTSITADGSGNVYTTGYFQGTVDFDPGEGTTNHTSSVNNGDVYVQKLDASGNFIWAKSFGGIANDVGTSITVDGSGNVYSIGVFQGTVDFDPGTDTTNITAVGGYSDIYVQKLDASGNFIWAKAMGGSSYKHGSSIAADELGNVYTTGYFNETVDFDPGEGITNHTSEGDNDIYVQKLDTDGNLVWVESFGSTSGDVGNSIIVDGTGNVYTTGSFRKRVDFDPGERTVNLNSVGDMDVFVLKMSQNTKSGVIENKFGHLIKVYPNPAVGAFTIDLGSVHESINVIIRDGIGRIVSTSNHISTSIIQDTIDGPTGIYFIEIASGNKQAMVKLIIE
jgi:hypothetical protein